MHSPSSTSRSFLRALTLVAASASALVVALAGSGSARAQANVCPPQTASDRFICFGTGDITAATNRTSLTYAPTTPFVAGSQVCAFVDVTAELEQGGWDQVYLRFSDGASATGPTFQDFCLAGNGAGVCDTNLSPGCEAVPTVITDTAGTYCYQPTPGATNVTVSVYVKTQDGQYQCGDCGDQLGSPGVTVHTLEVTGCTGFPTGACGNGILEGSEQCDDHNDLAHDGCAADCRLEPGAICDAAGTTCAAAGQCHAVTPGPLGISYCYGNGATDLDTSLAWIWSIDGDGTPLALRYDIAGGLELYEDPTDTTIRYDELWFYWEDDAGGSDLIPLNIGHAVSDPSYEVWSRGTLEVVPTAGATILFAEFIVFADDTVSCADTFGDIAPLGVSTLELASCDTTHVDAYDSLAAFTAAVGGCYEIVDFNAIPDGTLEPISGDGYVVTGDSGQGIPVSVEASPYPSTFADGDGTPALDPQIPESYLSNSRLRIDFAPGPAKAVGMTFIDVGDIGGVMSMEAYRDGQLVFFDPDIEVSSPDNNFITTRGFVFDQAVDSIVFSMIEPSDAFDLDNLVVIPQDDQDDDGVPDLCDCAPADPKAATSFAEICDDQADNDCDGFTDDGDFDCGGTGSAACQTYADENLDQTSGGWLVAGDTSWGWNGAAGRWEAESRNNLQATLESQPLGVPSSACPGDFKVDVELGGIVASDGDALVIAWSRNGGPFATLKTVTGTLSKQTLDLTGLVVPGDAVSFRFAYVTNSSGVAVGPFVTRLRLYADEDRDHDLVCDGCDCAPQNAAFGLDCDVDGDGWCASTTGPLNPSPLYAGCDQEIAHGNPQVGGSDCRDDKATANPGLGHEDPFCSDGVDNDCDGKVDGADPDCAQPTCTDPDGDGYGSGTGCLGPDCREGVQACTTDCSDADHDNVPDCDPADTCRDADADGYGVGPGCTGPDCDDTRARCAVDCTTDLDSDSVPDCSEDCVDADGDQYGNGPGCRGFDCDDTSSACTTSCVDVDGDQLYDCRDGCLDADKDGFGTGPTCAGPDCDDLRPSCAASCVDVAPANGTPDCAENCVDPDGDGYGVGTSCTGADCKEGVAACNVSCRDDDHDGTFDCDPADGCLDADGDGYGAGPGCTGPDCDDHVAECTTTCADSDDDQRLDCDPRDDCHDVDHDGYGTGPGCDGADCDDAVATCALDCVTDNDHNDKPDCAEACIDADKDGYGQGPGCAGPDCDDAAATCTTSCVDDDLDQTADCKDSCFDKDHDGFGVGPGCTGGGDVVDCDDDRPKCTTDCADLNSNGTPDCAEDCVDHDGDGYGVGSTCLGPDCDDAQKSCTAVCVDQDVDGTFDCADGCVDNDKDGYGEGPDCGGADCDDALANCNVDCGDHNSNSVADCNEGCKDLDQDGFGVGADCGDAIDCDDRYAACTTSCTHADNDGIPDCADDDDDNDGLKDVDEAAHATNPLDPDSDDDGLFDGAEVYTHHSDPTDPDSDKDGLRDGDEVLRYATDPADPDTDHGGVDDGREVADGTNPLDPSDDRVGRFEGSSACAGGGVDASWLAAALVGLAMLRRRARA
ncbi:MAG: hypothetical protein U1F43_12255 [Myxococcota bacterium]